MKVVLRVVMTVGQLVEQLAWTMAGKSAEVMVGDLVWMMV